MCQTCGMKYSKEHLIDLYRAASNDTILDRTENKIIVPSRTPVYLSEIEQRINEVINNPISGDDIMALLCDLKMLLKRDRGYYITELGEAFGIISVDNVLMFAPTMQGFLFENYDLIGTYICFEHSFDTSRREGIIRSREDSSRLVLVSEAGRLPLDFTDRWSAAEDSQLLYLTNVEHQDLAIIATIMRQHSRVIQYRTKMLSSCASRPYYYSSTFAETKRKKQFMWINPWVGDGVCLTVADELEEGMGYEYYSEHEEIDNTQWRLAIDERNILYRYDPANQWMKEQTNGSMVFHEKLQYNLGSEEYSFIYPSEQEDDEDEELEDDSDYYGSEKQKSPKFHLSSHDYLLDVEFDSSSRTHLITTEEYDDATIQCECCKKRYSIVDNPRKVCPVCRRTPEEQSDWEAERWRYSMEQDYINSIDWDTGNWIREP